MKALTKKRSVKFILSVYSICAAGYLHAGMSQPAHANVMHPGQQILASAINHSNFEEIKNSLWNKYIKDVQALSELRSEYDNRALTFQDKTMRFSLEKRGTAPDGGYPLYIALHGGGQTSHEMNDSQWDAMKVYYRDSVNDGIYVATRGITDNWKLHFEDESYPLYEKLIESAILFDGVNPNRVYFLGFSAGGDGVYQVVTRMPERFAAGNMSAGHHNWITFDNLYNTPFLMQVGELDSAYNRNRVAAENNIALNNLQTKYSGGFTHDVYIHYNGYHNTWRDNDASRRPQTIIADPSAWLEKGIRETKSINTNAIDWLNQYTRKSMPDKLVWDLSVDANNRVYQTGEAMIGKDGYNVKSLAKPHQLFYWLDVSVAEHYPEKGKLVVQAIKSSNTITVLEAQNVDMFRILLNPDLLDLSKPVNVVIGDKLIGSVSVKEDRDTMVRTLLERSDKNEIYDAQITLSYNKDTLNWMIVK